MGWIPGTISLCTRTDLAPVEVSALGGGQGSGAPVDREASVSIQRRAVLLGVIPMEDLELERTFRRTHPRLDSPCHQGR